MTFDELGFSAPVSAGIAKAGYEKPTPIQAEAIPTAMEGHDLIGIAQTGSGKTAAFVLPILQRLQGKAKTIQPRALIIGPTRELAEQTQETIRALGGRTGLRSTTIYGGVSIQPQLRTLRQGVDIVVACPGRLLDHLQQRTISLEKVEMLVLDEADQMFDMGFLPSIERILKHLPKQRQTMLFSATMPDAIRKLTSKALQNPKTLRIGNTQPAQTISHAVTRVEKKQKTGLLLHFMENVPSDSILVFTRTKHSAKRVALKLADAGYAAASLQGNLSQGRRQEAMDGFRSGKYKVLVATDIAARGIDVSQVSHVVNYDIPATAETYTHRIGRTGRAERKGEAITFVTGEDKQMVRDIERHIGKPLPTKLFEGFKAAPPERGHDSDSPRRKPMPPKAQRKRRFNDDQPRRRYGRN